MVEIRSEPITSGAPPMMRSLVTIISLSVLTLALGFLVQVVLAARLGTSREMDAYLVAITVPALISSAALVAFPASLVPVLKEQFTLGKAQEARTTFTQTFSIVGLCMLGIAAAVFLGAGLVIEVAAPGFDAETARLSTGLVRIMIVGVLFDVSRGVLSAYFYAQERFFLPQFVPIINHLIMLFGALYLLKPMGLRGLALAWDIGSVAMFMTLFLDTMSKRGFEFGFSLRHPGLRRAMRMFAPAISVAILNQATLFVDRQVASTLPEGSISYLGYGSKMLEILMRTVPMAVALALFPLLSQRATQKEWEKLSEAIRSGTRWMILGTVPLAIAVATLRVPLVTLLFERGVFDRGATVGVAEAVGWYAWVLIPGALIFLFTFAFFSLQEASLLARIAIINLGLTALLDVLLAKLLGFSGMPVSSLTLNVLWVIVMGTMLAKRFLVFSRGAILAFGRQVGAAAVGMGLAASLLWSLVRSQGDQGLLFAVETFVISFVAMAVYVLILHMLGNPDLQTLEKLINVRTAGWPRMQR